MELPIIEHGLDGVEIFQDLDPAERTRFASELETLSLKRGEVLMREGEAADAMYVVVTGRFAVTVEGGSKTVPEIGPGHPIGEIAFLAGGTRTATVTALRDSLVLKLDRAAFDALAVRNPGMLSALNVRLARRLAEVSAATRRSLPPDPQPRTIALIRAGGGALPGDFAAQLIDIVRSHHSAIALSSDNVSEVLPAGARLDSAEATSVLNALEGRYDYVIFVADSELTPWSEKAIRQADLVIAVSHFDADPAPNQLERLAASLLPAHGRRLVLLHPTRTTIKGTSRWLDSRAVNMHHHVALDSPEDLRRLYRFINGSALGFVACGGGAYCVSHIGLYRAFLEAGVEFDIVGGSSGGGAMTAAFALGEPTEKIHRVTNDIFVTKKAMGRYTWPLYSLLDHTHFDHQLSTQYGVIDIEDLWRPFFTISTNLSTYDLHVHNRGDLFSAVRATGSIPVLFPPFYTAEGHMLVDGALTDNVPVRTMHDLKAGPNIVAAFSVPKLRTFDVDYKTLPGRNALLKRMASPFRKKPLPRAPNLGTVLMRSIMANPHVFEQYLRPEDVVMTAPLPEGMGILDWNRNAEVVEGTYRWAQGEIARMKAENHPIFSSR